MNSPTVASATRHIEDLLRVLDNAYWEAGTIERKDAVYAVVSTLHEELAELAKLSVEDHGMLYQPVTPAFRGLKQRLHHLRIIAEEHCTRPSTSGELENTLAAVCALIS